MSDQPTLFDAERDARDAALVQVEEHAEEWSSYARTFLVGYLRDHATFSCDDLWAAGLLGTRENRALGAVLMRAARDGLIVKTDEYRPSLKPGSHLTPRVVWRSLLYREAF